MKYLIKFSTQFKKDIKKAKKQSKNIDLLFEVIEKLANGGKLDRRFNVHKLSGKLEGIYECHIEPDLLFEYQLYEMELILLCIRLGSHSEIFR